MLKKSIVVLSVLALAAGIGGCASKKPKEIAGLPAWVMLPEIKDGIAATECVPSTGDMSVDKTEATALARAGLAKQLDLRVKAMDETYRRTTRTEAGAVGGGTFESVSKQVSDVFLQGARVKQVDYVTIENKRNLCVMVTIEPDETKKLFDKIVTSSQAKLDAQSRDVMYEEFKAYKAQQRLDEATSR